MADTTPATRRTLPSIPADDPRFVWTPGADVQATWRRFGWKPSGRAPVLADEPVRQPAHTARLRRAA